jgi:hypothetical protein
MKGGDIFSFLVLGRSYKRGDSSNTRTRRDEGGCYI